ncbi:MAG: YaiO family outer membrane beta-barrel protein [Bacteroidia bacterium]|nr:YaiO family outer membrane beta-barrel protein [Bacteroidia bacterium]
MTSQQRHFFFIVIGFLMLTGRGELLAQTKNSPDTNIVVTDTTNLDALFSRARELSYAGNNTLARKICQKILEKKPNYYDVRTFIGRTWSWEKQYDNARTELSRVLIEKESDYEALNALIDVELWTKSLIVAGDYLKIALGYYPTSEDLLLKKARLQVMREDKEDAAITLQRILELNPGNKEALDMLNGMSDSRLNNRFQMNFSADYYPEDQVPQTFVSGELGRAFNFGSIIYRASVAKRYNRTGFQQELDSYARFMKGNYFYFNVGFGDTTKVFPKFKAGAEMFQKLPAGFELSGGWRYLLYTNPGVNIYTGSLGNYFRNYWINLRVYMTPKKNLPTSDILKSSSQTYILEFRNYFGDAENYISFRAGNGQAPDDRKVLTAQDIIRLKTISGAVEYQKRAFGRWIAQFEMNYYYVEVRKDVFQQHIVVGIQMKTIF